MTLGAYYRPQPNQLVLDGLSGLSQGDQFAVQTLQELVGGQIPGVPAMTPVGVFAPWAQQSGSVDWVPESPDHNILVYPLLDAHVSAVKKATFGQELPTLAVLTASPVTLAKAEAAFDDTPYRFAGVEAVYKLDDTKPVPTAYFLYLGELREPGDAGGGTSAPSSAASLLGGKLVAALPTARTGQERPHPQVSFGAALATQVAPSPPVPANVVPVAPKPTSSSAKWWLLPLVGAAAAYGGYRWYKGRKKGGS